MGAPSAGEILGAAHFDEPRASLAGRGQMHDSLRTAQSGLRLVHRGVRHEGLDRGQDAAWGAGRMNSSVHQWLEEPGLTQYVEALEAKRFYPTSRTAFWRRSASPGPSRRPCRKLWTDRFGSIVLKN